MNRSSLSERDFHRIEGSKMIREGLFRRWIRTLTIAVFAMFPGFSLADKWVLDDMNERKESRPYNVVTRRRKLSQSTDCTLYLRETQYDHEKSKILSSGDINLQETKEREWLCEISIRNEQERGNISNGEAMIVSKAVHNISEYTTTLLVAIEGVGKSLFEDQNIMSGETIMRISEGHLETAEFIYSSNDVQEHTNKGTNIFDKSSGRDSLTAAYQYGTQVITKIFVPPEASVELLRSVPRGNVGLMGVDNNFDKENIFLDPSHRRMAANTGKLKTLVIRVIAKNGSEPSDSKKMTEKNVFYDRVCLKSQYAECSKDQLMIEPFAGTTSTGFAIQNGVVDVQVDINPISTKGGNHKAFENRAYVISQKELGCLECQFDLVLFCFPPGTGTWAASATINRWDSYYNDKWCGRVSAQVHEVGHNLGLDHSGEGKKNDFHAQYADQSGMMGLSYSSDDSPRMCFNPAKNFQLDWYKRQRELFDPTETTASTIINSPTSKSRTFVMNGFVDYKVEGPTDGKLVVLGLTQQQSSKDYFIGYNRAVGPNEETQEDKNRVIILEKPRGGPTGFGKSWKLASLQKKNELFVISKFGPESDFVEVKLLSDTVTDVTNFQDSKEDVTIAITSYKAAETCMREPNELVTFKLKGKTDNYGFETSWSLKVDSTDGGYVDFGSGYGSHEKFKSFHYLCPGECYVFEIRDVHGDGICDGVSCDIGSGFYEAYLGGNKIFEGSTFGFEEKKKFCVVDSAGDTDCKDETLTYRNRDHKNCNWVAKKKKKRCKKEWKGEELSHWCRKACKVCD